MAAVGNAEPDAHAATFGHIPGVEIGSWWLSRKEVREAHVHGRDTGGIYGRKKEGAFSIILKGNRGFANEDHGETFTYVGSGGRAKGQRFGDQTCDQTFANACNASLVVSTQTGLPIRVVRGYAPSQYAPYKGYRYDGLYRASNPRLEEGPKGFKVCRFDFTRLPDQAPLPTDRGGVIPGGRENSHDINEDESDDEDLEALFLPIDEIKEGLILVEKQLNQLKNAKGKPAARELLLARIGMEVNTCLRRKEEQLGRDGNMDYWRRQYWMYVATKWPMKRIYSPLELERLSRQYQAQHCKT